MSWKGLQKTVVRAPQQFRQRMNMGPQTKDPVYLDAEDRCESVEEQTRRLHTESRRYWTAINQMLQHQIEFSRIIEEVYKPISGRLSDPNAVQTESNPEALEACQQYHAKMAELQQLLQPELQMIESRIIRPSNELLEITQSIKKMFTKREHKQLDLDRRLAVLQKLQDKQERSVKDEERLYKAESDVEIAREEFNFYNDLLKDELPKLFALEVNFIRPMFQAFYYMQLNVFYTMYVHMQDMKIPYFNLDSTESVAEAFHKKHDPILEQLNALPITHFRTNHAKLRSEAMRRKAGRSGGDSASSPISNSSSGLKSPPPYDYSYYDSDEIGEEEEEEEEERGFASPRAHAPYDRDPHPPPRRPTEEDEEEWCTAQYDYNAQSEGDLNLKAGDRIIIVDRSTDPSGWWTGKRAGQQGIFPANYVVLD